MIAKALFLAKAFYRCGAQFFRDHESRSAKYPSGYLCEGARLFRVSRASPCPAFPYRDKSSAAACAVGTTIRSSCDVQQLLGLGPGDHDIGRGGAADAGEQLRLAVTVGLAPGHMASAHCDLVAPPAAGR